MQTCMKTRKKRTTQRTQTCKSKNSCASTLTFTVVIFTYRRNSIYPRQVLARYTAHQAAVKQRLLRVIAGLETQGVNGRIQFAAESWLTAQQVMAVEDRNIGFVFSATRFVSALNCIGKP